jgi:hypothetical protein
VQRKAFLLRLDPQTYEAIQRWADAELRSLNAQIEFVLRDALRQEGRLRMPSDDSSGRRSRRRPEGKGE